MARVWVSIPKSFFQQGPDFELEKGWMSVQEAKSKCLKFGDEALGITVQDGGTPKESYCTIVPKGTQKFATDGHSCLVYKVELPPSDGANIFSDQFVDCDNGYDGDWARPGRGDGFGDEYSISLFEGIGPGCLHQGAIGDCWLISSFAAMAEFPEAVRALFTPNTVAVDGRYKVKLYSFENKRWQHYEVDDRLPEKDGRPLYVGISEAGEIWPCLLEKAFAYYSGKYTKLIGGYAIFALGAMTGCQELLTIRTQDGGANWGVLTGCPDTDRVHHVGYLSRAPKYELTASALLTALAEYSGKHYVMCSDTQSQAGKSDKDAVHGIHLGHAYSLLVVMPNCAGSGFDLLCLRNPWGEGEWDGDWSDESELWDKYPKVAAACGHTDADDGLFWMTFQDYCTYYTAVYVCCQNMGEPNRAKKRIKNKQYIAANPGDYPVVPAMISRGLQTKRDMADKATHDCGCQDPECVLM